MARPPTRVPLFLAEAGCNHNGDLDLALQLLRVGAEAGADVVKFQAFRTELLVTDDCPAAAYQNAGSQSDLLRGLELNRADFEALADEAHKLGVGFVATPFDDPSLALVESFDVPFHKVSSGDINNLAFLERIAACGRPVVLSTGTATLGEVDLAVRALRAGHDAAPERLGTWQGALRDGIVLLHCVTQYPAPDVDSNLRAMQTLRRAFDLPVGYSDHTLGLAVSIAAVALGAEVIEKHFTLSCEMEGPDHRASIEPDGLRELVDGCRRAAIALGSPRKMPATCELDNRAIVRKSLVATRELSEGHVLEAADLRASRPLSGIGAEYLEQVLGARMRQGVTAGTHLTWEDISL